LRKGVIQVINYLLRTTLVNNYLIALYSETKGERFINFRSQDDFRIQLIELLLDLGTNSTSTKIPRKREFSYINKKVFEIPVHRYKYVKMPTRKDYTIYKRIRFSNNLPKRIVLAEITYNRHRTSTRKSSWYGCR
jgi:hypothetical protein